MFLDPAQQQTGASSASYDIALRRALRTKRKRAELEFTTNGDAIAKLPAPPQPPDDEVLFCFRPDLSRLPLAPEALSMLAAASASSVHGQDAAPGAAGGSSSGTRQTRGSSGAGPGPSSSSSSAAAANGASPMLPNGTGSDMRHAHARVGRCGRVYVVRCNPLSMEPLVGPETILPPQSIPAAVGAAAAHEGSQPHWATVLDPCIVPDCVERGTLKALRDKRLQGAHQAAHYQADMYRVHQRAQNVLLGIPLEGSRPSGGGRTGPGGGGGGHVHTGPGVTGALSAAPSVALFHTPGLGAPQGSQAPPGTLSHTVGTPAPMGGSSGAAAAAGAATAPAAMQRKAPRVGPSGGSASGGSGGGGGRLPSPSPAGGAPVGKQAVSG